MGSYRLTRLASADYKNIGRYTQQQWGAAQRKIYLADLVAAFERLATSPNLGRSRDEVRKGLYSYPCGRHVIFYRNSQGDIEIVRILHDRQSLQKAFEKSR
jgi:toxin ParE1/3/4